MTTLTKEPYAFDPDFERAVVTLCALKTRFWSRIGYALDPECMGLPGSKLTLQTCALIAREVGHGPGNLLIIVQRFRRMMADGKMTLADIVQISAMFDDAEDFGLPNEDDVVAELAPMLRRRMQSTAVVAAHDEYAKKGDFSTVIETIRRAERLGEQDTSVGTILGAAGFDEIDKMNTLTRLPTGVLEMDLQMSDGLHRGGLGVVLGASGDGKSMYLVNQAGVAVKSEKLFVGVATLELPKPVQLARLYANLTGIYTNQILENATDRAEAKRRMAYMAPHVGACVVEEFAPHATTVQDLVDWCNRVADLYGRPFDVLVVDYADKLHHPMKGGDQNEYLIMRYVYEGLRRDIAVAMNMWVWTASQAARATKDQGKRLEMHHVSDSMHKVRVADIVLTLNAKDEGAQLLFFVAKNRLGKARFQVGPVPTDFERARIVPATAEFADWAKV
jgi:KaiC/GvpD/RAD55 family RecA-like ATPase